MPNNNFFAIFIVSKDICTIFQTAKLLKNVYITKTKKISLNNFLLLYTKMSLRIVIFAF